ncbi:MAG: hypothetical protein CL927_12940 [Deltaproteobacteria bacterium]|nr:hypothetical protein [Deltaproteobacteria bacterium]HCH65260.1 hypothetical protein [Deltaproteobacteria bacterium]
MPCISSPFLDCTARTPAEAVCRFFMGTQDLEGEDKRALTPEDVLLVESAAGVDEFVDEAWTWRLAPAAPVQRDFAGTAFVLDEHGELRQAWPHERRPLVRGVVGYRDDYGGYAVCVDGGDGDSDENLMEYAIAGLGLDD